MAIMEEMLDFDIMRLGNITEEDRDNAFGLFDEIRQTMLDIGITNILRRDDLIVENFDLDKRKLMLGTLNQLFEISESRLKYLGSFDRDGLMREVTRTFGILSVYDSLVRDVDDFYPMLKSSYSFWYTHKKNDALYLKLREFLNREFIKECHADVRVSELSSYIVRDSADVRIEIENVMLKDVSEWTDCDLFVVWHSLVYSFLYLDECIEEHFNSMYYRHRNEFRILLREYEDRMSKLHRMIELHDTWDKHSFRRTQATMNQWFFDTSNFIKKQREHGILYFNGVAVNSEAE